MKTPPMGTIIRGTHCPETLVPMFAAAAMTYGNEVQRWLAEKWFDEWIRHPNYGTTKDGTRTRYALEMLTGILEGVAPPECYFGEHPHEEGNYGFWLREEQLLHEIVATADACISRLECLADDLSKRGALQKDYEVKEYLNVLIKQLEQLPNKEVNK